MMDYLNQKLVPDINNDDLRSASPSLITQQFNFLIGAIDPSLTFTRASNATYFDNTGTLQTAGTGNLVAYSVPDGGTNWSYAGNNTIGTANQTIAPDGTNTAALLIDTSSNTNHSVTPTATISFTSGTAYTVSCYLKQATQSAAQLFVGNAIGGFYANFNLNTGAAGTTNATSSTITSVGNGWYRCSMTFTSSATTVSNGGLALTQNSTTSTKQPAYVGNGTGIYFWGYQDEASSSVTTYSPTSGAASGAFPRFDYNPSTLALNGLLIEESRTNLFLNSATPATQNITTSAVAYTVSFYGTGTIVLSGTGSQTINGSSNTTRTSYTFTASAGTLTCTVSGNVLYPNVEAGSFPTSYIPTAGATVTRAAESLSTTSISWFSNVTGSITCEAMVPYINPSINQRFVEFWDGTTSNRYALTLTSSDTVTAAVSSGAVLIWNPTLGTSVTTNAPHKLGMTYASANFAGCADGGTVSTQLSGALPVSITQMMIGNEGGTTFLNGWLRKFSYYNTALTSAQLQTLTT